RVGLEPCVRAPRPIAPHLLEDRWRRCTTPPRVDVTATMGCGLQKRPARAGWHSRLVRFLCGRILDACGRVPAGIEGDGVGRQKCRWPALMGPWETRWDTDRRPSSVLKTAATGG